MTEQQENDAPEPSPDGNGRVMYFLWGIQVEPKFVNSIVPLTNGHVAWFPFGPFYKAFEISEDEFRENVGRIRKFYARDDFLTSWKHTFLILFLFPIGVYLSILVQIYISEYLFVPSFFLIVGLSVIVYFLRKVLDVKLMSRIMKKARIGFSNDYMKLQDIWMQNNIPKINIAAIIGFILFHVFFYGILIVQITSADRTITGVVAVGLFCLFFSWMALVFFRKLYAIRRFRLLHGRDIGPEDLLPVDPVTGKMTRDPFAPPVGGPVVR
ncbi:MAG: hypothetical protein RJQ21_03115 [Rhodospirillales bacterium]